MKTFYLLSAILVAVITGCEPVDGPVIDNPNDTAIPSLFFTVDTTYIDASSNKLVASGIVRNTGRNKVNAPWHVEAQFYTTKTSNTKLGGSTTQINIPLSLNQETFWTIKYSSSNVNVNSYPDFGVRDLRGIYKN